MFNWAAFDALFSNNPGKDFVFELGEPADWMISRAAIGGSSFPSYTKGNMCPTTSDTAAGFANGLAAYANFVTQAARRMRDKWGVTGAKWELWNEIDIAGYYADAISSLGPYAMTCAQAVWAEDPTAIILAPSVSNLNSTAYSTLTSFLTAPDSAGGPAKRWIQGITYHSYEAAGYARTALRSHWNQIQAVQAGQGLNLPTWITEAGYDVTDVTQAADHVANMIAAAAFGARCYIGYGNNSNTGAASYALSPITTQWNAAAALLTAGATIPSYSDGQYAIQVVINGTTYTF